MFTEQAIQRVRAFRVKNGWTIHRLAREARLPDSTIRKMDRDDWNPTAETLSRLEAVVAASECGEQGAS